MVSLTIKNIPEDVYTRLKEAAASNRRSINSEVITIIDEALRSTQITPEEWIPGARKIRELTAKYVITDEEFNQAKRAGRE
jgi:plasmid stability protein